MRAICVFCSVLFYSVRRRGGLRVRVIVIVRVNYAESSIVETLSVEVFYA